MEKNINVRIPTMKDIFKHKCMSLKAVENTKDFNSLELDKYKEKYGVYIHYQNDKILYVGQTTAESAYGNFRGRLKREFIKSYSHNSALFNNLLQIGTVKTVLIDYEEINNEKIVTVTDLNITNRQKSLILEQCLIAAYNPEFNKAK